MEHIYKNTQIKQKNNLSCFTRNEEHLMWNNKNKQAQRNEQSLSQKLPQMATVCLSQT